MREELMQEREVLITELYKLKDHDLEGLHRQDVLIKIKAIDEQLKVVKVGPMPQRRKHKKVGRNQPCPCGAVKDCGDPKKFKKCCGK